MPDYIEPDEAIEGLSFLDAHRLNAFRCAHCGKTHPTYVGAMFDHIPGRALEVVRTYVEQQGLAAGRVPGLARGDSFRPRRPRRWLTMRRR